MSEKVFLYNGVNHLACLSMGSDFNADPQTSGAKADGRFGKQDFVYLPDKDAYRCPAGALLPRRLTTVEKGQTLHRYLNRASCTGCP